MRTSTLFSQVFLTLSSAQIYAMSVAAEWFTSQTSSSNVVETGQGGVRLANATSGSVSGQISLPIEQKWKLLYAVINDEDASRSETDTVEVIFNGISQGSFSNAVASQAHQITFEFFGDLLEYEFIFSSANSSTVLHQRVAGGRFFDETTHIVGFPDNFSFTADVNVPSASLQEWIFRKINNRLISLDMIPGTTNVPVDSNLGHTFLDIPGNVTAAELGVSLLAGTANIPETDLISLFSSKFIPLGSSPAWSRKFGMNGDDPGLLRSTEWQFNDRALLNVDLQALPTILSTTTFASG